MYQNVQLTLICISNLNGKSYLDQKYDQEVEVGNSSELLEQILGNEVPEGVLLVRKTATVTIRLIKTKRNIRIWGENVSIHGLYSCLKLKQQQLGNNNNNNNTFWTIHLGSEAVLGSPWRRQCGCQGNAEGCRPRLPVVVLYVLCRWSDCPPRSPPPHTDEHTDQMKI